MKNGCNEILEAKIVERNERAKKLYRYVTDVARRVSELTTARQSIAELFSIEIEVQRQKLRDYCEKLMFLDPLNYGKKTLELLWRKVYYETVSAAKKLRESTNDSDSFLYSHIECGIGHFNSLIERVQSELSVSFKELDYMPIQDEEESQEVKSPSDDMLQFGKLVVHSCLIYLGDLSRYQVEIFQAVDPSMAARYYLLAAHIDLTSGMPHNQLGNLYMDKNYNLDSACYYIHCLNCTSPFEGALGNLTKIFEKNAQFEETCNLSETLSQTEHIQIAIVHFLSLIEIWYLGKDDTNISQRCNVLAHEFKVCMGFTNICLPDINKNYNDFIQVIDEENTNPSYMNPNIIHKIVQICLFTMAKVIESDESKAFACKAFTLALLSQLLQKLLKQLQSIGLTNPASKHIKYSVSPENEQNEIKACLNNQVEDETDLIMNNAKTNGRKEKLDDPAVKQAGIENDNKSNVRNGDTKNSFKRSSKRRRRRRIASSESSDLSGGDTESSDVDTVESCSDEEDLTDSTCQSEDEHSDETDIDDNFGNAVDKKSEAINSPTKPVMKVNGDIATEFQKKNSTNNLISDNSGTTSALNVCDLQTFLQGDNFLASIKLLQDWILLEKDLILSCGESGESLFQCVVDLHNIFTFHFNNKGHDATVDESQILIYARSVVQKLKLEYKTVPLPEDINLRGTNICRFDKDAAEWQILEKYKLTVYEENIIRILHFIDFGNQVAKIVPRIRFNRSLKVFYLKKTSIPKLPTKLSHKRNREWHNSKKQHVESSESGLLRQLGRLWLTSQVRELERSGQSATPALLVVDTASLNKHLRRVKSLVRARNFILLIPTIVLQELDNLKREHITAREAIRWLELQLRSGSRFLRAQRPGQARPLPLLKYPRKAPQHVHNFIQILEFCNHFLADEKHAVGGNGDSDSSLQGKSTPFLILLVGSEPGSDDEQYKEFSVTGAAQAAGISVEQIGDFYTKWRQTVHKNGKKR